MKEANKLIDKAQSTSATEMRIVPVKAPSIYVFSDAAHGKPASPQAGMIAVFGSLSDAPEGCQVLHGNAIDFYSRLSRRVARSTFAAETYVASDAIDRVLLGRKLAEQLFQQHIPVISFTDCQSLVDCLNSSAPACSEQRVLLEVLAIKEAIQIGECTQVRYVSSATQLADGLTKPNRAEQLVKFLRDNTVELSYNKTAPKKIEVEF